MLLSFLIGNTTVAQGRPARQSPPTRICNFGQRPSRSCAFPDTGFAFSDTRLATGAQFAQHQQKLDLSWSKRRFAVGVASRQATLPRSAKRPARSRAGRPLREDWRDSLRKRGGVWRIDVYAPNGKRVRRATGTAKKALAQQIHAQVKADFGDSVTCGRNESGAPHATSNAASGTRVRRRRNQSRGPSALRTG